MFSINMLLRKIRIHVYIIYTVLVYLWSVACIANIPIQAKSFVCILTAWKLGRDQKIDGAGGGRVKECSLTCPTIPCSANFLVSPQFLCSQYADQALHSYGFACYAGSVVSIVFFISMGQQSQKGDLQYIVYQHSRHSFCKAWSDQEYSYSRSLWMGG